MKKLTIGKSSSNDIVISDDSTVSRSHAFLFSDNIHIYISDCNSLNGTYVNGLRVQDAILNNLDILKVGNTVIDWAIYFNVNMNSKIETSFIQDESNLLNSDENIPKGKTANSLLFSNAWNDLNGQWGIAIGFMFLAIVISFASGIVIIPILISAPLAVGQYRFWLNISRRKNPQINDLFKGFNSYASALGANLLVGLIVVGGMLLLIIPGIYWAFTYAMVNYIIAENPDIGGNESLVVSRKMMEGHKWKLFRFGLRVMAIFILCIFTLGIGLIWAYPWVSTASAKFYDDIK